jgi:hypothetical protein
MPVDHGRDLPFRRIDQEAGNSMQRVLKFEHLQGLYGSVPIPSGLPTWLGAQEGAPMRNSHTPTSSQEPTHRTREDIRAAVGRCLCHFYDGPRKQPLPDHLRQLLDRLESDGTWSGSGAIYDN